MKQLTTLVLCLLLFSRTLAAEEDLTVLKPSSDGIAPGKLLELDLKRQAFEYFDARRVAFDSIKSQADCIRWQTERREFFIRQIGGFPERTPLNARVVRKLKGKGYRVENVIFESRAGHHVTANLYLPDSKGPYPGVIIPCGHSHNGKAAGGYQRASILMAKHGMAALCYDPIGQGERYQMLDFEHDHEHFASVSYPLKVPHPRVQFLCTVEHTAMGLGCILLGTNTAQYRIWDGMRAIDYLQSRDDIIADRIGCTGNSGGGTLTSYLMALDDRIVAAAPACYLTTFRKLIETKGAQDAEQNIFGQLAFGMDEPDYVMMRAPKPTLVLAGRRDATFNIDGTWDLFRQSKSFYSRLGYPERVAINDADLPHGFYMQQREAAARWMHRWLLGEDQAIQEVDPASLPDPISDKELRELSEGDWTQEELYCSPKGQVLLTSGEKSVFDLNVEHERKLRRGRTPLWKSLSHDEQREVIRKTIGGQEDSSGVKYETAGIIRRPGYVIEKVILTSGSSIPLPALAFIPANPSGEACLYLHGTSMTEDAAPGGPIESLVKQGQVVLAAELRGIGETEPGHDKRDYGRGKFGRDVQEIFLAYLIGQSYVGLRTEDVFAWSEVLKGLRNEAIQRPLTIHVVGIGEAAIPTLHAAALRPTLFKSVKLRNMIPSWADLVAARQNYNQAANVVHGALRYYDLPDLIELARVDNVTIEDPVDALGNSLNR